MNTNHRKEFNNNSPIKVKTRTISRDLTVSLLVIVILVITLVTLLNYWFVTRNEEARLKRKADEYMGYLVESLEFPLWSINDKNVFKIAESYFNNDLVAKLTIIERYRDRVLFDKKKENESELIHRSASIQHHGKIIGRIELSLSPRLYKERTRQILWSSLLMALVIILSMITMTRLLFRLLLRKPFDLLIANIDKIAEGKYSMELSEQNYRELNQVLKKFKKMETKIRNREQSLTQVNNRLEQEIQEKNAAEIALKTSEEQLQSIIDNIPSLLYLKDLKGQYILVNHQFERIFKLPKAEIIGKTDFDLVDSDTATLFQEHDKQALDMDAPVESNEVLSKDNGPRSYLSIKFPVYESDGKAYGVCGISTDITELKETQQKIADALEFNEKIFSESPIGVSICDESGQCITANDSIASIIGSTKEEVLKQNIYQLESWKKSGLIDAVKKSIAEKKKLRHEIKMESSFGVSVALDCHIVPFFSEGRDHTLFMTADISQRIRAEEETNRLRQLLKNIVDSMSSIIVGVDTEGKVTQWNLEAARRTGIKPVNALGKQLDILYPTLYFNMSHIQESIQKRQPLMTERVKQEEENKLKYYDVAIFPLVSTRVDGAVIRVDEVTERVQIEELMIQSEKMMSVGGLAAGMAHEINNPLAAILQNVQLMRNRIQSKLPKNRDMAESCGISMEGIEIYMEKRGIFSMINSILLAGQRASKIVDNMLSFSRKGAASAFDEYDLAALLDKTIELAGNDYDLKKEHDFRKIEITKDYDASLPMVLCEGSQIQQVFLNVLKNGAQAMGEYERSDHQPSRFKLEIKQENGKACVIIEDNGPGMDEITSKRVFEPFFTTKDVGVGTGLGLSLSYFIITKNHKGQMNVMSFPGKGTRFVIHLPLQPESIIDSGI